METNTKSRDAMLDKISQINAVEGFDPSAFVEEYEGFDGKPITGIPVAVQEAWFRLKSPEGRVAVHAEIGLNKDSIVAHARIYKHTPIRTGTILPKRPRREAIRRKRPTSPHANGRRLRPSVSL